MKGLLICCCAWALTLALAEGPEPYRRLLMSPSRPAHGVVNRFFAEAGFGGAPTAPLSLAVTCGPDDLCMFIMVTNDTCATIVDTFFNAIDDTLGIFKGLPQRTINYVFEGGYCSYNEGFTWVLLRGLVWAYDATGSSLVDKWRLSFGHGIPFYGSVILPELPLTQQTRYTLRIFTDNVSNSSIEAVHMTDWTHTNGQLVELRKLWSPLVSVAGVRRMLDNMLGAQQVAAYFQSKLAVADYIMVTSDFIFVLKDQRTYEEWTLSPDVSHNCSSRGNCFP